MRTGVLLLNFGGPPRLQDVRKFLYRLFSDPAILVGMPSIMRKALALGISVAKAPSSKRAYALIGCGLTQSN